MTLAQAPEDFLGIADVAQDHPELVAAQPGHGVLGPGEGGQPPGQLGEKLVPVVMTQGVVDLPEPVEIDDGQRRPGAVVHGGLDGRLGAPVEEGPIGQVGQEVVLGQELVAASTVGAARD